MNSRVLRYLLIVKNQKHPLRFLASRIIVVSGLWRLKRVRRNNYYLYMHPSSLSMSLWVNKRDRQIDSKIISALLRSGDTFVDVGANIGHLSIEAAIAVESGRVISFEAHPRTAELFRQNVILNKINNIVIVQAAVGSGVGFLNISDMKSDDENRICDSGPLKVPSITLDLMCQGQKIRLLKVDVEGFEKFVFEGGLRTLENTEFIYFEVYDANFEKYGYKTYDLIILLNKIGFNVCRLDGLRQSSININELITECTNFLAYRDLDELRSCIECA